MKRKTFNDISAAITVRDAVEKIASSVVNRMRPESFYARVESFDSFSRRAKVRTASMVPGDASIDVTFHASMQPHLGTLNTLDEAEATIVEVEGHPGSYIVKKIIYGPHRIANASLVNPRVLGGTFDTLELESRYGIELEALPALNQTIELGYWTNDGMTVSSGSNATVEVRIVQEQDTNQTKIYRFTIMQRPSQNWESVFPDQDTGSVNGNDFALEVKVVSNSGFYLRVRRLRVGFVPVTGTYYADVKISGSKYIYNGSTRNTITSEARPTKYFGTDVGFDEASDQTVNTGPFQSGIKHHLEYRMHSQVLPPDNISWDSYYLFWTGTWKVGGFGNGDISSRGYLEIAMPTGAGEIIAVHGLIGEVSTVLTSGEIEIRTPPGSTSTHTTLYYDPTFGGTGTTVNTGFHLVYTELPFKVPSHWIMLAMTNPDQTKGNSLMLGNGTWTDYWRIPTLSSGWVQYGAPYEDVSYRKVGDLVYVRGTMKSGTLNATPFALPVGFRPAKDKMMMGMETGSNPLRFTFFANGNVTLVSNTANGYVSFEGTVFESTLL